jgi:SAM-dependent methyltransferase
LLEIGSGIGNISSFFIDNKIPISLSDTDEYYIEQLQKKYSGIQAVVSITRIDIQSKSFPDDHADLKEKFDAIFLLNVLEHLEDDHLAIENIKFLLKPGGTVLILTPAYPSLYSKLDRALGHYRRYRLFSLTNLLRSHQLSLQKGFYFNSLGILAWWYAKLRQLETIPNKEMRFYNVIVPVIRIIDKLSFRKFGLSVIISANKTQS